VLVVGSSVRGSVLRLIVQVSGRGRVRASGARVTTVVRAASKAGRYTLKVPLSRGTRVAVKARRKVKVSVKVALTPPFGAPVTAKFSRTLGK
jgi:hypothetical protein